MINDDFVILNDYELVFIKTSEIFHSQGDSLYNPDQIEICMNLNGNMYSSYYGNSLRQFKVLQNKITESH